MKPGKKNFWKRVDQIPPILVRLLARKPHGRPLTEDEISKASGLPIHQVYTLSWATSWAGVDIPTMQSFLRACRVDFCDWTQMQRVDDYLNRKPTWKYLRASPAWESMYQPMIQQLVRTIEAKRM